MSPTTVEPIQHQKLIVGKAAVCKRTSGKPMNEEMIIPITQPPRFIIDLQNKQVK
jgi:hypothetical protein